MKNMIDTEHFINEGCTDYEIEKLTNINDPGILVEVFNCN